MNQFTLTSLFSLCACMIPTEPCLANYHAQVPSTGGLQADPTGYAMGGELPEVMGNPHSIESFMHYYLSNRDRTLNKTTAEAIWQSYEPRNLDLLTSIALNTVEAQTTLKLEPIPTGLRTFATYGLASAAARSKDLDQRVGAIATLVTILEETARTTREPSAERITAGDLQVAAIVAIGLIPLPFDDLGHYCYCGTCKVSDPTSSLQGQITYLMPYFTQGWQHDANVRTATANALASLALAGSQTGKGACYDQHNSMKMGIASRMIETLSRRTKQPQAVRISSILVLGLLGDADGEYVDRMIRNELLRQADLKGSQSSHFALLALAETGSRSGKDQNPWACSSEVRKELLNRLMQGDPDQQSGAGLALGVFGHRLHQADKPTMKAIDDALQNAGNLSDRSADRNTYNVALDLRRSRKEARKTVLGRTAAARSYVAMAIGVPGDTAAIANLQDLLDRTLQGEPSSHTDVASVSRH